MKKTFTSAIVPTLCCALLIAISQSASAQQTINNDLFESWSKLGVGSEVVLKTVSKTQGQASEVNIVQKLAEKNDKQVVLDTTTKIVFNGMEINGGTKKITIKKQLKTDGKSPDLPKGMKQEKKGEGKGKVTVGGKSYDCNWVEYEVSFNGITSNSKTWTSKDVPGGLVKSVVKTSTNTEAVTELVKFTKK